jgi:hypothetical protein
LALADGGPISRCSQLSSRAYSLVPITSHQLSGLFQQIGPGSIALHQFPLVHQEFYINLGAVSTTSRNMREPGSDGEVESPWRRASNTPPLLGLAYTNPRTIATISVVHGAWNIGNAAEYREGASELSNSHTLLFLGPWHGARASLASEIPAGMAPESQRFMVLTSASCHNRN